MVRNIRSLFGSQKEVAAQAMQYLHALADETRVRAAIDQPVQAGLGVLDGRQRLIADSEPKTFRACSAATSAGPPSSLASQTDVTCCGSTRFAGA
jgi:hypothetical protein